MGTHRVLTRYSRVLTRACATRPSTRHSFVALWQSLWDAAGSARQSGAHHTPEYGSCGKAQLSTHKVLRSTRTGPLGLCIGRPTLCTVILRLCTAPTPVPTGTPAPTNVGDTNPPTFAPTFAPTLATFAPTLSPTFPGGACHAPLPYSA